MAAEGATEKRANLVASKVMWSNRDDIPMSAPERSHGSDRAGICRQNNVQQWLRSHEADAKPDHTREAAAGLLKRNGSSEDDLALGIEASLYGKQGVRTVQEFLRSSRSSPVLTRWNSLTSAFSAQSAPLSVMDVLNLWSDDPEEVLLDLGFGCDEPDISGRIPARFINNQSSARGINIQVFLDAQKNRMDIENPDVSNRFRQLEVLQQVTTAFSSLVGGASTDSLSESGVPALASAEAREKRKRMGMLLRRVSRKTLSQTQIQTQDSQDTNPTPHSPVVHLQQPLAGPPDRRTHLKRARQGLAESICLTPLVEEQGLASEAPEPHSVPQEGALRLEVGKEYPPLISSGIPTRKKSPGEARESFEMEEIQSFDEGSISGSYMGASDTTAVCVMRTNSCQSDSSGFLEEPFIPSITQHPSPGPELMKALSGISGGSTDSQITVKGASPPSSPPSTSLDPFPPSLSTCHPRPESPLYRPETTSPTEETPRHQDSPTPHSLLSDALEMTNSAFGARPSLMENTVTEEDGFSSACCAPCHKPDSPLRHVIIIMKTDRETEHFTLESEEADPIGGEEKAIAEQSGNVQTGTEAVGDQDTDCYGSHEGSLMDSVALVQMKKEMKMKMEVEISSGLEGPVLGPVAVPEVVDQGSETGSVCQDRSSEDPLLGSDPNLSAVLSPASPLPPAEPLSASCLPTAELLSASSPPPVHWETGGSEISEGSSSLVVQEPVPPLNQPTNPSTDLPPGPALTSPSEQVSLPSPASSPPPSPSPASCPHQPPASAFLAASNSSPTQSHSPIPNHSLSALTTTPILSSIPNSPSAHSLTVAPSQAPTPLVPHSGAFRSGRSVSVQMPSSLPSVSHSALRRGAVPHTPSPLGPSFEPLPLTDLMIRQRRNSFSRKAWSDADVSHFAEHRNTAVAMGKADMTPETISLPSPCPSPSMSSSNRWLSRDGSRRSGSFQMKSTSLDTGLWQEEVGEEVGDEDRRWERALFSGLSCCCSCDNRCRCCSQNNCHKPSSVSAFPYSLDELEGMMHCMRKFRCVLTDIEEQLSEDQASVYSSLSDTDREEVRDVLELRKAVKREAGELELQLTDLVHRYDDSFKMKMHRLLDEQSHLYTQLRLLPLIPTTTSTPGSASSRSMATQCCLLPWLPLTDMSRPRPSSQATWDLESRSALPDSGSMGQRLKHGSTGTKPDKLDIVGFIQRLKESIRHSVNTDSLE